MYWNLIPWNELKQVVGIVLSEAQHSQVFPNCRSFQTSSQLGEIFNNNITKYPTRESCLDYSNLNQETERPLQSSYELRNIRRKVVFIDCCLWSLTHTKHRSIVKERKLLRRLVYKISLQILILPRVPKTSQNKHLYIIGQVVQRFILIFQ